MFVFLDKGLVFVGKVNKRVSDSRVILDLDMHEASSAKKGVDIGEGPIWGPITNLGYF